MRKKSTRTLSIIFYWTCLSIIPCGLNAQITITNGPELSCTPDSCEVEICGNQAFSIEATYNNPAPNLSLSWQWKRKNEMSFKGMLNFITEYETDTVQQRNALGNLTSIVATLTIMPNEVNLQDFQFIFRKGNIPTLESPVVVIARAGNATASAIERVLPQNLNFQCEGGSYTVQVQPSSQSGEEVFWYDEMPGPNVTPLPGGASDQRNFSEAGTYYARREACSVNSEPFEFEISFIPKPTAPTSISGPASACANSTITLQAQGSFDSNDNLVWYEGIINENNPNPIGTGTSIDVTIGNSATTYRVRNEAGNCGPSNPATKLITVTTSMPDNLTGSISFSTANPCVGDQITLSVGIGDNNNLVWYRGNTNSSNRIGTGNSLSFTAPATNTLILARNEITCDDQTNVSNVLEKTLNVTPVPQASFASFPDVLCRGIPGSFSANDVGSVDYNWTFQNGSPPSRTSAGPFDITFNSLGNKTVRLTVSDGNCSTSIEDEVMVVNNPVFAVNEQSANSSPEFIISEGVPFQATFTSSSELVYEYNCIVVQGNINGTPPSGEGNGFEQNFQLNNADFGNCARLECEVMASAGSCESIGSFFIEVCQPLFVPNILTPGSDDGNQVWNIEVISGGDVTARDYSIKLYNRAGNCIKGCDTEFTADMAPSFDGLECPPGAHMYIIDGPNGFQKIGHLTIIK